MQGDTEIVCTVMNDGPISNHKGVNVPGVKLNLPFIDEKDHADIVYACEKGFDFIAASFVRSKEDVLQIREILKEHNSKIQIISKIESLQGIQNLEEIIEVSDGIMVARGDMGVEIPMEEVPIIQKRIIKLTTAAGKNVITATQMLDSMMKHPRPTVQRQPTLQTLSTMAQPVLCFPVRQQTAITRWKLFRPWFVSQSAQKRISTM